MKVIIVGGVASGATCSTRLRRLDEKAEIVLLERGSYISYANCGLPYYVGGVIKDRSALLIQTPEAMKEKFNIDVRVNNEVLGIDRKTKTIRIKDHGTGTVYEESYDKLVLGTGSSPIVPKVPGIESRRIHTLWTVPDADELHEMAKMYSSAVVIGGGFIGVEMAENLHHAGLSVSMVEAADQIMAPVDFEMAQLLHQNIRDNGVELVLGDAVSAFRETSTGVEVELKSGKRLHAQMVVMSIGVRPNTQLAAEAGLQLSERGFVSVNEYLQTSDPDIYACGDITEYPDVVLGGMTTVALAGPANKQGRIVADNLAGTPVRYMGAQGTSVAKVFDLSAAATGANEKRLLAAGLRKGVDYETVIITQNHHAGYYPGAVPMVMKLIFSCDGRKIFGAQVIGADGADKRIDVIATAIRLGATVHELEELELGYGPVFSSAKDPVNMLGFTAMNVVNGLVRFSDLKPDLSAAALLDIRTEAEQMAFELPGAYAIPLEELRDRQQELPHDKPVIVLCSIGVRSYNAARMLMQSGFSDVQVYPGGIKVFRALHETPEESPAAPVQSIKKAAAVGVGGAVTELDCCGLQCPGPLMKVYETMNTMQEGQQLSVSASDPGFTRDIEAWCRRTGNTLVSKTSGDKKYTALLQKGQGAVVRAAAEKTGESGKTIIVFSGDFDKVMASFIIANGAAAMGRPVTMFFTFWGLTALRRQEKQAIKKSFMESMFGAMLPRGVNQLGLSRMNMAGMGTAMMKKIMNDKNVNSLEDLIKKAMENGVRIQACSMSMDVMGIRKEELIDGVEIVGVGSYLASAEESDVNLFI